MPKLTPEESKAIGGAAAEAEKQAKAKAAKDALNKLGKSVEDVKFQQGPLNRGTRIVTPKGETVVGEKDEPAAPKQQLRNNPKPLPKAKPKPSVGRGPGGRIVSLKKQTTISKRKQTRTGKKLDVATGRIAIPLVKRGEGGRAVGTTPEERAASVRTEITPSAKVATSEQLSNIRETMQPAVQSQTMLPKGVLQRGGQRKLRGFPVPHSRVKAAVDAAVHHLGNMKSTRGTPEFDQHEKTFDAIHSNIQAMDKHGLGITVGQLKHQTLNNGSPHVLNQLHNMIQDRLEEGRMAEAENKQRANEGRARKAGN